MEMAEARSSIIFFSEGASAPENLGSCLTGFRKPADVVAVVVVAAPIAFVAVFVFVVVVASAEIFWWSKITPLRNRHRQLAKILACNAFFALALICSKVICLESCHDCVKRFQFSHWLIFCAPLLLVALLVDALPETDNKKIYFHQHQNLEPMPAPPGVLESISH